MKPAKELTFTPFRSFLEGSVRPNTVIHINNMTMTLALIQNLGPMELMIIFFVVLIFFGAKRLPGLFASFGHSIKEFRKATQDIEKDIHTAMNADPKKVHAPQQSVPHSATREDHVEPASRENPPN
jgi:sec-independent protein translocase protein TatA